MRSYWKSTVFNRYGGEMWLFTLIATGRVHVASVEIVNEIIAARIREEAKREPVSDPVQAQPLTIARASSPGQVKGVQHQKNASSRLRDNAKLAVKHWQKHYNRWRAESEKGRLTWQAQQRWRWQADKLWAMAEKLWAEAEEESIKAGHPFQDRDGTMVRPGPVRLGIFESSLNTLVELIEVGKVTWPPEP